MSESKYLCKNFWWGWHVSLGLIQSLFSSVPGGKTEYIGFRLYSASLLNPFNHSLLSDNLSFIYLVLASCRVLVFPFALKCLWHVVSLFFTKYFCCVLWVQEKFKNKKVEIFILTVCSMQFYSRSLIIEQRTKAMTWSKLLILIFVWLSPTWEMPSWSSE